MDYKNIYLNREEGIAYITINRPDNLNALNGNTVEEISNAIDVAERDTEVKVVIITGSGEKAFVAGADIAYMQDMSAGEAREFSINIQKTFRKIECLSKPVIAAVNGYCLGAGCELAMACDFRIASQNAKMGLPEVGLGVIPGAGGTQRLARLTGEGIAKELLFTGEVIDAAEALRLRLVNKVVPGHELMDYVKSIGKRIISKGQIAVNFCKTAVHEGLQTDIDRALCIETNLFSLCFATSDQKEGMRAFTQKRPPNFTGR